uniref:Putative FIP1[III]-like protein n=1 Tax=Davidia involucrata TaxID=16924 RepID=A0A5B6ZIG5_DAVIN
MSMDSDDHESGHISNVDRHHHHKVTICTSEGDVEAMETSNNTREEVGREMCNTAPSIMEIESSLAEQSQCYPSSSSSGSHCEAFSDGACIDPEKNCDDLRRPSPNSVSELQKSVTSDHYYPKDSKRHGVRTKHGDCKYYSRGRSPISEDLKHYSRRLHSVPELKNHSVDDNDASPMSNTQGLYDVDHSTDGRNCQKERLHCFDSYDGEHFSYYRESELSFNYYGERFSDNQVRTIYKNPYRKGRKRFGDETDRYLNRKWDEGEYFLQQRIPRVDEVTDRDLYHYKGGHTIDDMGPLTSKESRRLASKHSSYLENERATRWSRKGGDLQFRKRMESDEFLVERKYTDDFMQGKFGRSILYNDTERDYLDKYEGHTRGEVKSSGRSERKRGGLSIDSDNFWSRSEEDKYWRCTDQRSLSSRSYKELHTSNGGRWHDTTSLRNDVYDLRKTKRHERHRRQIWTERCKDSDWISSYSDAFDTEESINCPDDQVHFERRRHWHSDVLHWNQNGHISRQRDDEFHAGEASFSFERNSRHKKFDAKYRSDHVGKLIDDRRVERHRYKILREGNSGIRIDRSPNIAHSNYEKTLLRCGDSVDFHFVVGEGKSLAGDFTCSGRHENMALNIDKEHITSKDFNESHMEKTGQADNQEVEDSQNDEKWHDKFPDTQQNEALDIEEGQIITEELNENLMEKECVSENVAHISDVKERTLHNENAPDGNEVVGEYDNHRILETLAKMEKRRERFKEPITLKKEKEIPKPLVDPVVEAAETKQHRPARKRRWGGS